MLRAGLARPLEEPLKTIMLLFSTLGFLQIAQVLVLWGPNSKRKSREWGAWLKATGCSAQPWDML